MFRKYPAIFIAIIIVTILTIYLIINKGPTLEDLESTSTNTIENIENNSEDIENIFKDDGKFNENLELNETIVSSVVEEVVEKVEEIEEDLCNDEGCLEIAYLLKEMMLELNNYDILEGANYLTSSKINDLFNITRDEYDSFFALKGNDKNKDDLLFIIKVNPNNENKETYLKDIFGKLFSYRDELIEDNSDNNLLLARYGSANITQANDYILFFILGDTKTTDLTEALLFYQDIQSKLTDGYYYSLGKIYNTSE